MFMSLQRLGAGCPLHAPNANLVCGGGGGIKKVEVKRKAQQLLHMYTHGALLDSNGLKRYSSTMP